MSRKIAHTREMKPRTAFLIDDDVDDLEFLQEIINQVDRRVNCISFPEAEDAINILTKGTALPDIIFVDYNMPKIDGKQCVAIMRSVPVLSAIPVIVHSTAMTPDLSKNLLKLGATHTFRKPNTNAEFLMIMEEIFQLAFPK